MWHHVWHWLMDFIGVNNTYDTFSTHMYNFWSGIGGSISVLALIGTLLGLYRHNQKQLQKLNPLNIVKTPLTHITHKDEGKK